ncbi:TPA: helix-turn-helix domain-containing protein [Proteus mirabilis]|uniref:LexA family protein n=1 Tax=Proteus mirabilis TaxID=584 RepID=UPI001B9658CB|nr:helix-turn-helix domain-containing protein [Proteus mirabilis]HBC8686248.1 helix-turn-helix domain-containing protein [Proteus mirabilis]HEK1791558.1 helix-turn-helix domain-containing protein [Proteus mirabilis]HEK2142011.1 helix-turn-helix domain-containing protein [Proteus mirabilis]HEK2927850.1 helix-turn-helix domain-containing protein [Proteus mirabilis]
MNIDDNFKNRIQLVRQSLGLTQGDLADKVGVVRRQIAAYEAGDSKPRINVLNNLAATLGATAEWLAQGIGEPPEIGRVRSTITLPLIPVISFAQAGNLFKENNDDSKSLIGYDYIAAPQNASSDSFAIVIEGESMQSDNGMSFTTGSLVIFDPLIEPTNGDFVLCRSPNYESAIFKQYIVDQGHEYLASLNNKYSTIPLEKGRFIIGVAIESRIDFSFTNGYKNHKKPYNTNDGLPIKQLKNQKNSENINISERLDKIESMLEKLLTKNN